MSDDAACLALPLSFKAEPFIETAILGCLATRIVWWSFLACDHVRFCLWEERELGWLMGRPTLKESAAITDRIVEVAARHFLKEGFDGTTMEAVAIDAGVPKTTLYKRFPDKRELLQAVLAERVKSWSAIAARQNSELTADLDQRLYHYTRLMLLWGTAAEVRSFLRLASALSDRPDQAESQPDFFGYSEMVDLLAHDIQVYGRGSASSTRSPAKVALVLMSLISGWITLRGSAEPMTLSEAEADARFLVDMLCGGMAAW